MGGIELIATTSLVVFSSVQDVAKAQFVVVMAGQRQHKISGNRSSHVVKQVLMVLIISLLFSLYSC